MNILKTYKNKLKDENGDEQELVLELTEQGGVYGFACHLMPAGQHAADGNVCGCFKAAETVFDILCRENVLPLNLYPVLDDLYTEISEQRA